MTTAERDLQQIQPELTSSVTFTEFINAIKRNKGAFWTTLLTCIAIGVIASLLLPPKFAAGAEILVEGSAPNGVTASPENIIGELTVSGATYPLSTQIELLQSQDVFFEALDAAGIAQPTTLDELRELPKVSVRQKKESNIFLVVIEGNNEDQVEKLARAYPDVFRVYGDRIRNDAAERAEQFVLGRKQEEEAALALVETEYTAFKNSNQVVDSAAEVEVRLNLLTDSEQRLADARATEGAAIAAADQARKDLTEIPEVRNQINDQSNEVVLIQNRQELNNLEVRREELLAIYQPSARPVQELDRQIKAKREFVGNLEDSLRATVKINNPEFDLAKRRYSEALANRDAAVSRRQEMERLSSDRQQRLNSLANLTKQQREIERRIALHSQSIQSMNDLLDRVRLRNNSIKGSSITLTRAVSAEQSQPNWIINMTIATLLGLAFGVVFALVRDSSQDKVNTREEAYMLTGLSMLSNIPERSRSKHPIITNPQNNLAFESYRVLRSNIDIYARGNDIKSLAVTSALRKEGKSVVASNLAIAYVLSGKRTILVDANMRYPSLHTLFGSADKPGLGDLLLGTATVNDVLQATTVEGLYVVTAGTIPANSTEVMGSPRMQEIIALLSQEADMLVIDAPHVAGLADAPSLAAVTDASILVTQVGKANKSEYKEAVGILDASSPALLGIVFNRVSSKQAHITKA